FIGIWSPTRDLLPGQLPEKSRELEPVILGRQDNDIMEHESCSFSERMRKYPIVLSLGCTLLDLCKDAGLDLPNSGTSVGPVQNIFPLSSFLTNYWRQVITNYLTYKQNNKALKKIQIPIYLHVLLTIKIEKIAS
ncbi:unnamed protein product, partial [Vicia faba]